MRLDAVLRLLRGADQDELADELGVTVEDVKEWRDAFIDSGAKGLPATPVVPDRRGTAPAAGASPEPTVSGWRAAAIARTYAGRRDRAGALPSERSASLRERKKAKTRAMIRHHAMRLFQEQGYYETTVNQIAEAAEVSPSTFFRYFANKEDVVFDDDADALLVETFRAQPPKVSPVEATYKSLLAAMEAAPGAGHVRQHIQLCLEVPELRMAAQDTTTHLMAMLAELVAERVGRRADDVAIRTFAAAVQGVWTSVLFDWAENPEHDLHESMAEAMALLEAGLPL